MPEFHLDTSGHVEGQRREGRDHPWFIDPFNCTWRDIAYFDRGYIEALFFTESSPSLTTEKWRDGCEPGSNDGSLPGDVGFSDLAPGALRQILQDCDKFKASPAWKAWEAVERDGVEGPDEQQAGRDFWYTRNSHGCGFWDGDWPEPHATELTDAAKAFGEVYIEFGDDDKVHL